MMTAAVYVARVAELLRAAAATDEGQAVAALVSWGRRQVDLERAPG